MSKKKNILLQIILSLSIISLVIDLFVNENKSHIFVMIASILISLVITQLYLERKKWPTNMTAFAMILAQ